MDERTLQKINEAYVACLSEYGQGRVIEATRDITDRKGNVVIGRGKPLGPADIERLRVVRTGRPIYLSLAFKDSLSAREVVAQMVDAFSDDVRVRSWWRALISQLPLDGWLDEFFAHPQMRHQFTLLHDVLPERLRCTYFSAVVAAFLLSGKQVISDCKLAFFAGLVQDVGWLYRFEDSGFDLARQHPILARIFLEAVPSMPKLLCRAVGEHHEHPNGIGEPQGLTFQQLSQPGCALATANDIYRFLFEEALYSRLSALRSVMALRAPAQVRPWYQRLLRSWGNVDDDDKPGLVFDTSSDFFLRLLALRDKLCHWKRSRQRLYELFVEEGPGYRSALWQRIAHYVHKFWFADATTGVLSEPMHRWIQYVQQNKLSEAEKEMEELWGLLVEMNRWHDVIDSDIASMCHDPEPHSEIDEKLKQCLHQLVELS